MRHMWRQRTWPGVSTMRRTGRKWWQQVTGNGRHWTFTWFRGRVQAGTGIKRPRNEGGHRGQETKERRRSGSVLAVQCGPVCVWPGLQVPPCMQQLSRTPPLCALCKSLRGRGESWNPVSAVSRQKPMQLALSEVI